MQKKIVGNVRKKYKSRKKTSTTAFLIADFSFSLVCSIKSLQIGVNSIFFLACSLWCWWSRVPASLFHRREVGKGPLECFILMPLWLLVCLVLDSLSSYLNSVRTGIKTE